MLGEGPSWSSLLRVAAKYGTAGGKRIGTRLALNKIRGDLEAEFGPALAAQVIADASTNDDPAAVINHYRVQQEQERLLSDPPPLHGSANWATWHELTRAGLLDDADNRPEGTELYLGAFLNPDPDLRKKADNWLFWDGVGHVLTIAPSGAGKALLMLIPNLLRYTGSCVVFDPKGELYRATSAWRARLGPVYRLAPFEDETHAFNLLEEVRDFDDAVTLASYVFPAEATAEGKFYEDEARAWLSAVIYFVARRAPADARTMIEVRSITALTGSELTSFIDAVARSGLGQSVTNAANVVRGMSATGRSSLLRSLNAKLAIWDSQGLSKAAARSDFDFRELKHRTATIYVTVPIPRLEAYGPFVQAVLTTALETLLDEGKRPDKPILFAVDEFLALGPMPRLASALRTHREAGVRLWYFLQNLADLQHAYPDNWKAFFADTEIQTFFGTKDSFTAELLSGFLGQYTVAQRTSSVSSSQSARGGWMDGSVSHSATAGIELKGRPLMFPNEVLKFLGHTDPDMSRFSIDFISGRPVQSILLPWSRGDLYLCRYGELERAIRASALLERIWIDHNDTYFDGALKPLAAVGWQDFADGREGGAPPFSNAVGFFNWDIGAIVLVSGFAGCEGALARAVDDPDGAKVVVKLLGFLEAVVLHEMLHQATFERLGTPYHGHGDVFLDIARQVHARMPTGTPPPTTENVARWPDVGDVDEIMRLAC